MNLNELDKLGRRPKKASPNIIGSVFRYLPPPFAKHSKLERGCYVKVQSILDKSEHQMVKVIECDMWADVNKDSEVVTIFLSDLVFI
jgi:hypothetical protein